MSKSVSFARPARTPAPQADAWVGGAGTDTAPAAPPAPAKPAKASVPMKRLTLDVPEDLHRRVKAGCAVRGEKIADVVRRFLDAEFPAS